MKLIITEEEIRIAVLRFLKQQGFDASDSQLVLVPKEAGQYEDRVLVGVEFALDLPVQTEVK